jgi:hypothetical protein
MKNIDSRLPPTASMAARAAADRSPGFLIIAAQACGVYEKKIAYLAIRGLLASR